ncbi:MAG TPA: TIM barrel protein [Anaerolineales bacterium]|nr:TIM barrel protein [Anaerolineales bacterium]
MIKVANAPVSWGVIEKVEGERSAYARVLDEIAEAGYAGTELGDWGFLPTDPDLLATELEARGLELMAGWVGVAYADKLAHADGEARAVQAAQLLAKVAGRQAVIVLGEDPNPQSHRSQFAGRIQPEHALSGNGWEIYAEGVNRIALAVKEATGLRSAFHPHSGIWIETQEETERLLSSTDPGLVGLCFDTGHYRFGGGDPVAALRQFADRLWHVHFKDQDPQVAARSRAEQWDYDRSIAEGIFCELGRGDVDFPGALEVLQEIGYDGWIVVEQDVMPGSGSPKESARKSRDYLRSLGI